MEENKRITFLQWLKDRDIPYLLDENGNTLTRDADILPFQDECKELFPFYYNKDSDEYLIPKAAAKYKLDDL